MPVFPSNETEADQYVEAMRAKWEHDHEVRMAQWEYFRTPEYQQEVVEAILRETHSDLEPPWLQDPTVERPTFE